MSRTDSIVNAQELPCGARFFRCALQVNPFDYIVRHSKETVLIDCDWDVIGVGPRQNS